MPSPIDRRNQGARQPLGRGRPSLGITKKVSLTLTESEWAEIEATGLTVAAFLKENMKKMTIPEDNGILAVPTPPEERAEAHAQMKEYIRRYKAENKTNAKTGCPRRYVDERWEIYLRNIEEAPPADIIEAAKESMYNIMYPKGAETAVVRTHEQFECPFTGKRYGSMDKLIRAAIPHLIQNKIAEKQHKSELATIRERENSPKYLMDMR